MANISLEVVFGIFFLTLSGADVDFLDWELYWRTYTTQAAFPTTRCVELVGKKKFAAAALDPKHKTYVVHIRLVSSVTSPSFSLLKEFITAAFDLEHETYVVYVELVSSKALPSSSLFDVHLFPRPQIFGPIAKKALTKISAKYSNFADVFSPDLVYRDQQPRY